ncbi:hypothetical protein TYRP_010154 [Tyrophagus putrescentiae]|nr:hypothetical protein TYRP_010154 [Tyrophagus putrescentiae]
MANMAGSVAAAAAAVAVMLQQDRHSNVDSTLMFVRELAPCEQKASRQISEQEHDQRVPKKKSRVREKSHFTSGFFSADQ